jgi:RNA polymerase sigma factor (sigma-70 family)
VAEWAELSRWIAAAAGGDRDSQDRLVAACYLDVRARVHAELERDFRAKHRWILPLFSTQDVVQEVLTAVVRDLREASFPGREAFFAYLGTLVRHRLIDAVRFHEAARRDGRKQTSEPTAGIGAIEADVREATPTLAASLAERAALLQQALAELPERWRRLLELRLQEEQSFPQIAAALGYASAETARQALVEAQARLAVKLRARGLGRTLGG